MCAVGPLVRNSISFSDFGVSHYKKPWTLEVHYFCRASLFGKTLKPSINLFYVLSDTVKVNGRETLIPQALETWLSFLYGFAESIQFECAHDISEASEIPRSKN